MSFKFKLFTFIQLIKILLKLKKFKGTHTFFFPRYAMGGAEKVHLDIIKINKIKPLVIFTSASHNNFYKQFFFDYAHCIDVSEILKFTFLKRVISFFLKIKINKCKVVFGCNSKYYYELIPKINFQRVKTIDLFHSFDNSSEEGILHWSIPVNHKITNRVVINSSIKNDILNYYKTNRITDFPSIQIIENKIEVIEKPNFIKKSSHINVCYIGRYDEIIKRTQLVFEISKITSGNSNIKFHFAGFNPSELDFEIPKNCKVHGVLKKHELNKLYSKCHIILFTSQSEGLPVALIEAMNHFVVPISTSVGGIKQIIHNNENGFLIENDRNNEIIKNIHDILSRIENNSISIENLSRHAYDTIIEMKKKEHFDESYSNLLELNVYN